MITKADKGIYLVIINGKCITKKNLDIISDNNFTTSKDLTNTFQRELRNIINDSGVIIHKGVKWK
jgi:hypothetical protein